jgi:hypothetical protein
MSEKIKNPQIIGRGNIKIIQPDLSQGIDAGLNAILVRELLDDAEKIDPQLKDAPKIQEMEEVAKISTDYSEAEKREYLKDLLDDDDEIDRQAKMPNLGRILRISRWTFVEPAKLYAHFKEHSPIIHKIIEETARKYAPDEKLLLLRIRDAVRDEAGRQKREKQAKEQKPKRKRQTQKLAPLGSEPYMFMASDRANKLFVKSMMPNQTQLIKEARLEGLEARGINIPSNLRAVCVKDDGTVFTGLVGYNSDICEKVFRFFQEKSALAVKAHFALWARAHRETKADPDKLIKMKISQFCDDLGFQKKKRAHTRENKQHALQILETLTGAELIVHWQDKKRNLHRTKGNVWQRGSSDEIFDTHINGTNGQNENLIPGTEKFWNPNTFSYRPGSFFSDEDWRKFNNYVGLVGQGLLKLGISNKDKAAVLIGGYIAFLARIENYTREALKLTTIIENTGDLLTGYIDRREAAMLETIVENALDRLTDVKVIKGYEWVYDEKQKPSDSDKTVKMTELLARRIRLFFPDGLTQVGNEYKELETAHRKKAAVKKAKAEQAKAKRK